jgi:hypothetical protein
MCNTVATCIIRQSFSLATARLQFFQNCAKALFPKRFIVISDSGSWERMLTAVPAWAAFLHDPERPALRTGPIHLRAFVRTPVAIAAFP